jgi:hypothetical protein
MRSIRAAAKAAGLLANPQDEVLFPAGWWELTSDFRACLQLDLSGKLMRRQQVGGTVVLWHAA